MTIQGIIDTLQVISTAYPNYHPDKENTVKLWNSAFKSFSDKAVQDAVQKYIYTDTSGFAPVIGQIVSNIFSDGQEVMSEVEAWGYVSKALRNSGYESEKEFARLPESVKGVIGSPDRLKEWAVLDEREVQTVVASNFMRSYRAKAEGVALRIEGGGNKLIE